MKLLKKILVLFLIGVAFWLIKDQNGTVEKPVIQVKLENQKTFKFTVIADIHMDEENLLSALKKISENGSEFIIIAGDLTNVGKKDELLKIKNILDQSGLKYYVIPGNHDVWYDRRLDEDYFSEVFGKTYDSFKKENYKFILINNGDYKNGLEGLKGAKGQKKWIEEEVKECLTMACLVFMHMPLNHPNSLYVMGENSVSVATEAARLKDLFVDYKVKQVFAGHLHFSSSYELDGLKTRIVGSLASERNFQSPKFLQVEIKEGEIIAKDVFLGD